MATIGDESRDLIQEKETVYKANEADESFIKAKGFLENHNRVVITGVQGAGKTYLANSLVDDLENRRDVKSVWISNLSPVHGDKEKLNSQGNVFIFDEIFYESQEETHFTNTFEVIKPFMEKYENRSIIITIPSYIWEMHKKMFLEIALHKVHVNLDERTDSEKRLILKNLMKRNEVSVTQARKMCASEDILLKTEIQAIGFPALISWLCKQASEEEVEKQMEDPLSRMTAEIDTMKKREIGNYLILLYIALHGGTLDVNDIDPNLFEYLKNTYAPKFCTSDVLECVRRMVGNYLLENKDGIFEFDLNILKKIVFVHSFSDNALFIQDNCKKDYLRYVVKKDNCPSGLDKVYSKCYMVK